MSQVPDNFDWITFQRLLDEALAEWILREDGSVNRPIIDFAQYAREMRRQQENA